MNETKAISHTSFVVPERVISRIDVAHLVRDAEQLENDFTAAKVRAKAGAGKAPELKVTEQLTDFLKENRLKLKDSQDCTTLVKELRTLRDEAPVVHMTFAVEADHESLKQMVQWLRSSIHPQALLAVGLQPGLIAGVYLRTPNHVLDLSLRSRLAGSRAVLQKELEALRAGK